MLMGSSLRRRLASLDRRVLVASAPVLIIVLAFTIDWNNSWVKWLGFGQDEVKIAIPKTASTEDGQIRDTDITVTLPDTKLRSNKVFLDEEKKLESEDGLGQNKVLIVRD